MAKNEWGVKIVTDGEEFERWEWGAGDGTAVEAFVRHISIAGAKIVKDELTRNAMFDLQPGKQDACFVAMFFDGNLEFQMTLGELVADFIEERRSHDSGKIADIETTDAERLITQLERAAALIRASIA